MKKIGIVTLNGNTNYGNRLQNYALLTILKSMGYDVTSIWFVKDKKMFIKDFLKRFMFFKSIYLRYSKFKKFTKNYLNVKYYYDKNIESYYDYFVVGSDQVWNWSIYKDFETFYLQFSPKKKNIAYAASFAVDYIDEKYKNDITKGLNNINSISVREDKGKKLINDLGDFDVEVVLDPTLLLSSKEWDTILSKPRKLESKKYILCYFLGQVSEKVKNEIDRVASENNCDIINLLDKNSDFFTADPKEFLYLEKNAFLICTDSFHSSVFAIIYNVPFIVFDRKDKHEEMGSRLDTLLSKFKLMNRKFNGKITNSYLISDYSEAYDLLEKEKKRSIDFLNRSFK